MFLMAAAFQRNDNLPPEIFLGVALLLWAAWLFFVFRDRHKEKKNK